jgi:hypothetical protein
MCRRRALADAMALVLTTTITSLALCDALPTGGPRPARPKADDLRPIGPSRGIAKALFFIYQRGAATSKGRKCPMSPSCSEYGRLAVERVGLLIGTVMAADRLHRCGHDLRYYPIVFDDRGAGYWDPPAPAR